MYDMTHDMTHPHVWHDSLVPCVERIALVLLCEWLTQMWDVTHSYVWHDSCILVAWLIHACGMTHPCVWRDSFVCATWFIHVWHDSFICVAGKSHGPRGLLGVWKDWFICAGFPVCDFTPSYVRCVSFIFATWLRHTCDVTHACVWHGSFICATWLRHMCHIAPRVPRYVTWLMHRCDMTHSWEWRDLCHDVFVRTLCLIHVCNMACSYVRCDWFIRVTWLVDICDMTHSYVRHDSFISSIREDLEFVWRKSWSYRLIDWWWEGTDRDIQRRTNR